MANRADLELSKFIQVTSQKSAVRVGGTGTILSGIEYDTIEVSYPLTTREIYVYKSSAVVVATVTVNYTNASKNELVDIVRT